MSGVNSSRQKGMPIHKANKVDRKTAAKVKKVYSTAGKCSGEEVKKAYGLSGKERNRIYFRGRIQLDGIGLLFIYMHNTFPPWLGRIFLIFPTESQIK